jgi:hypothetical protein
MKIVSVDFDVLGQQMIRYSAFSDDGEKWEYNASSIYRLQISLWFS